MVFSNRLLQKAFFKFKFRLIGSIKSYRKKIWWKVQGASIGERTNLPQLNITWPHQLKIGNDCILEDNIFFKFDGPWQPGPSIVIQDRVFIGRGCEFNIRKGIYIGNDCLIGSGCKFIDHDHGTADLSQPMNLQPGPESTILLEENVWLGVNVVVLKGVNLGQGAVIGAGAIVTKSIPAYEIWGGIPARKIGDRPS
ncbi:acyltransferase [Nostoc sp.]|uniref:acyltransferase n=1 Tax=Nostoc sp. TaxID=1180 RepID=UPI002FF9454A